MCFMLSHNLASTLPWIIEIILLAPQFQERVRSSVVEAMLSRSAPVFYGDLRSHERVAFHNLY